MDPWREAPVLAGRHALLRPLERADRDGILAAFQTGLEDVFATPLPSDAM